MVAGFEVYEFFECESLIKLFPDTVAEEGRARLAFERQEVSVSGRGLVPDAFIELVRDAMNLTGVRSFKEFYARLLLPKPIEPTPELDRLLSSFKSVRKILVTVG